MPRWCLLVGDLSAQTRGLGEATDGKEERQTYEK
jgi:hypothetical protein